MPNDRYPIILLLFLFFKKIFNNFYFILNFNNKTDKKSYHILSSIIPFFNVTDCLSTVFRL